MATLKVQHLFKHYNGAKYISARDINFEVHEGEIFGFLGVNGAGKSTTIKCITGIIPFTSGKIEICGHDNKTDPYNAKKNFGFVPDNHAVYDKLTGAEYVNYIADLYGVPEDVRKQRFEMLCDKFKIAHAVNNQIASYSHGMKQKISITGALIHMPKLWILDEPMVGLDPQSIFEVKQYMREYAKLGNSVFFSSHNLDTVQALCDRAVIVHGGIVIADINIHEYNRTGKDLEKEFMELTRQAQERQNQMRKEIADGEAELATKIGKRRASKATTKKITQQVRDLIESTKGTPCVNTWAVDIAKHDAVVKANWSKTPINELPQVKAEKVIENPKEIEQAKSRAGAEIPVKKSTVGFAATPFTEGGTENQKESVVEKKSVKPKAVVKKAPAKSGAKSVTNPVKKTERKPTTGEGV